MTSGLFSSATDPSIYLSIDTASPSSLSIMRRDACVRIKSKQKYSEG